MTLSVSLDNGRLEYAGTTPFTLFAQPRNLVSPRFWSMLRDLTRFYREAPGCRLHQGSLGAFLDGHGYGKAFQDDHLLPMAAAIWSAPAARLRDYPVAAFIRFCENHGLLKLTGRPLWRTVAGGSRVYIQKLLDEIGPGTRLGDAVVSLRRDPDGVLLRLASGRVRGHDRVVLACHADQALAMLDAPSADEQALLGAFGYERNVAVLHADPAMMPKRRAVWSSWNYFGGGDPGSAVHVTYWMNRLQNIPERTPLFVTLNPPREPRSVYRSEVYEHPRFDHRAMAARERLWSLQGQRHTWFCGAYFGDGFHEDGLQSGLAVAEQLGLVRRPWSVPNESGRIHVAPVRELAT